MPHTFRTVPLLKTFGVHIVILAGTLLAAPASAQTTGQNGAEHPDLLDGTLSGKGDQEANDRDVRRPAPLKFPPFVARWFDMKEELRNDHGLTFGGSYGILWQNYSESLIGEDDAVGGKLTLNLGYELFRRGRPEALWVGMVVEDMRPLGTRLPPLVGGLGTGSVALTASTWGDFDIGITQLYLRNNLFDNRFQYAIGKLFAPNFVHAYPFFDDNRQFLNQAFQTLIPVPLWGFGIVGAVYPMDGSHFYIQSGAYTLDSEARGFTADDFFTKDERFYHVSIGWNAPAQTELPLQDRGSMDTNNLHVVGWYRNEQDNGTPEGHGVAATANYLVAGHSMLFLRGGWNDGALFDGFVTAGLGWRPPAAPSDLFGIGLSWAQPSNSALRSQGLAEMFYRFHLMPNLAITPDVQLIRNPALNLAESALWVFSLRARVVF